MSALPAKGDIRWRGGKVSFVPESDIQPGFPVLVVARFEGLAKAARRNFLSPGPHDR